MGNQWLKSLKINQSMINGVEIKQCIHREQSYKKHLHKELSIGLIKEGSTVVEFGGQNYRFKENDLIIIPPLLSHKCSPEDINQWQFIMLYIDPKYYENIMQFTKVIKVQGQAVNIFEDFIDTFSHMDDRGKMEELLIELLIELKEVSDKNELFEIKDKDQLTLAYIKEYLDMNYQQELSLDELEERFAMNKFTLIRKFKTLYNTTPSAYKLQLKVAEAKKYLDNGWDTFKICNEIGFFDQAHFIREFKKMYGVSPLQYKRLLNEKKM